YSRHLGVLPSSGSTPAPWEYSRPLGVLPPPGSTPDPWEFSRPLGVLPPSGSTPALWEYSRPLGVLESSLSPLRSFHSQHFGKNNRRFLNPCIHSTFIPKVFFSKISSIDIILSGLNNKSI
ncbi:unnamed protein product, partial [Nesidiocoris tenuis]